MLKETQLAPPNLPSCADAVTSSMALWKSKLPDVGTTIFTEMSARAQESGALNMSQGFPDFNPPDSLQKMVHQAMRDGHNQYAPMAGNQSLREWIAEDVHHRTQHSCCPDSEITIGAGASSLIFATIQALVQPNDEVIVLAPCYDLYEPAVQLAGGRLRVVPLKHDDFHLDFNSLRAALSQQTRLLIVNIPNNPTGAIWTMDELDELAALVKDLDTLILSDEVYGPMHYDGKQALSILHQQELRKRSLVTASFGKILHATGWKIGYLIASSDWTREIRKVHQYDVFSTGAPFQEGISRFLSSPHGAAHLEELAGFYQEKRDRLLTGLAGSSWSFTSAEAGYFQVLDYSAFDDRDDRSATKSWCSQPAGKGIALIPLSPFFPAMDEHQTTRKQVRVCFAKNDVTLDHGIERLLKLTEIKSR
jgi:methionine aminotransferase